MAQAPVPAPVLFPDEDSSARRKSLENTAFGLFQEEMNEEHNGPSDIYDSWLDNSANGINDEGSNPKMSERMNRRRQIVRDLPFVAALKNEKLKNPVTERRTILRKLFEHYRKPRGPGQPRGDDDHLTREEWMEARMFLREIRILLAHRALAYLVWKGALRQATLPWSQWNCAVAYIACIALERRFARMLPINFSEMNHSASTVEALYDECGDGDHDRHITGVELNALILIAEGLGFRDDVTHPRLFACAVECMMSGKSGTLQTFRPSDESGTPHYFPVGMPEETRYCIDTFRLIERELQAGDCLQVCKKATD